MTNQILSTPQANLNLKYTVFKFKLMALDNAKIWNLFKIVLYLI